MNDDALRRANLAGNLQNLWGTTKNLDRATTNDAQSVQPGALGTLGSIASAAGASLAGGDTAKSLASRLKYAGSSSSPFAANYVNSMDAGIQF